MAERLTLHFTNAPTVELDVEDWSITKDRTSGDLTGIKWTLPDRVTPRVPYVRLDSVTAVIVTPIDTKDEL